MNNKKTVTAAATYPVQVQSLVEGLRLETNIFLPGASGIGISSGRQWQEKDKAACKTYPEHFFVRTRIVFLRLFEFWEMHCLYPAATACISLPRQSQWDMTQFSPQALWIGPYDDGANL